MKKCILVLMFIMSLLFSNAANDQVNSLGSQTVIIRKQTSTDNTHLMQPIDCPDVFYSSMNSQITVDFGNQPVNNYTVTISTPFNDVDYYATSSFTTIPLAVDGISDYSIVIETEDGDVFEGTLYAIDYTTSMTI